MAKKRTPEELSVDELRWMLVEKRRTVRQERLERYRRTGRVVVVAPDVESSLGNLHSGLLEDENTSAQGDAPRSRRRRFLDYFLLVIEVAAVAGFIWVCLTPGGDPVFRIPRIHHRRRQNVRVENAETL